MGWKVLLGGLYGICPLLFSSQLNDPVRYPQFLGLLIVLLLVIGLLVADRKVVHRVALPKVVWGLLGGWVVLHLVSLTQAINVQEGIFETVYAVSMAVLFLVLLRYFQEKDAWGDLAKIAVVAAGLQSVMGLCQVFGVDLPGLPNQWVITGTHSNPNQLGSACLLMLPLVIWAIMKGSSGWKIGGAIVALMLVAVMYFAGSRAVWLALLATVVVAPIWIMPMLWRREGMRGWFVLGLVAGLLGLVVVSIGFWQVGGKKGASFHYEYMWEEDVAIRPEHNSLEHRFIVWNRSMDMMVDNPVLGVGAGNWKVVIPSYGIKSFDDEGRYGMDFAMRAHNDFLQTGAELGVLGLLGLIGFFVVGFWLSIAIARKGEGSEEREKGFLILLAFLGLAVVASFSFPFERIFQSTMFWTYLALAIALWIKKKEGSLLQSKWWTPIVGLVIAGCLVVTVTRVQGDAAMYKMISAKSKKNWILTEKIAQSASNWAISIEPISGAPSEWYLGLAQLSTGKVEQGLVSMQEARKVAPWHLAVRANLAAALEMNRQHAKAAEEYKSILETFPDFEESWLNLAVVYLHLGQFDQVVDALGRVGGFTSDPRYQAIRDELRRLNY